MLISAKLAPTVEYARLVEFWRDADELGYHAIWNYDHFYGLGHQSQDHETPTLEGWTTLAAMAVVVERARVGCMVTGVTYRHPAVLANMAIAVDHISGGRLEMGMGAAWHEPEHAGLGIEFPSPGRRVAMLDEALTVIDALMTQERASFAGEHFTVTDAITSPKPVQRPRPPFVVGGVQPKMLKVVAKHADEWNAPGPDPDAWEKMSKQIDDNCAEIGRDPASVRRGVQLFVHPAVEGQPEEELAKLPVYEDRGCQHVVLSFYQPPSRALLETCAPR